MSRLVADLLDLAGLEAGRLVVARRPEHTAALVRAAVEAQREAAARGGVTLVVEAAETLPDVDADRDRVLQVLGNLLADSLQATEGGHVTMRARAVESGRAVAFEVEDSGRAIPEEELAYVPRSVPARTRRGRARRESGLAVARGIVEAHGGRIWVESRSGQGSRVTFTLPPRRRGRRRSPREAAGRRRRGGERSAEAAVRPRPRPLGDVSRSGSENRTTVPSPGVLSAQILPPCASTSARAMARPRPVPGVRRGAAPAEPVEHVRQLLRRDAGPGVQDLEDHLIPCADAPIATWPEAVALTALEVRLPSTCRARSWSHGTSGRSSAAPQRTSRPFGLRRRADHVRRLAHQRRRRVRRPFMESRPRSRLGEVEQVADEPVHPVGGARDARGRGPHALRVLRGHAAEHARAHA